ncbi:MAG: hypothetical protein U0232_16290 [Thermomicrobiales bacterium]
MVMAGKRGLGRFLGLMAILVLCTGLLPSLVHPASVSAATEPRYFSETKHYVSGRFREFWEGRGGLFVFGLPLTSQFAFTSTDGKVYQMQFFERAVFELHPENNAPYDVLLTLVGTEIATNRGGITPAVPNANLPGGGYDTVTGHNVPAAFQTWWNRYGGLQNFGRPLGEAVNEINEADGKVYLTQYFERGRFEYHPENLNTPYEVLLGLLGRERLVRAGVPASATAAETSPPGTTPSNPDFLSGPHVGLGIQAHWYGQSHSRLIGLINGLGFTWTKQQAIWKDIEPQPGQYAWGELDSIVADTNAANIKLLLTVVKSPAWATANGDDGTPQDPATMGRFVQALTSRYRGRVAAVEIWNEENHGGETGGRIDPAHYAKMLQSGYAGAKAGDPNVIVVLGGLAPTGVVDYKAAVDDTVYLDALLGMPGVHQSFDVLGAHIYPMANPPDTLWSEGKPGPGDKFNTHDSFYFRRIEALRKIMVAHGEGDKQMWLTEWGWGSDFRPDGYQEFNTVTEEMRAQYEVDAIRMMRARYPWMGVTFLWNLNWSTIDAPWTGPAHYCILNSDYSPRPAYTALAAMEK